MIKDPNSSNRRVLVFVIPVILIASFGLLSPNAFADTVTATIPVGGTPESVAVNQNTNMIYVGVTSNSIDVIDGSTSNIVATVNAGGNVITVNPVTNMIYTAEGGTIYAINGSTNQVVKTTGAGFTGISDLKINPATNKIYAVGWGYSCSSFCGPTGNLGVINATTMEISKSMIVNRATVEGVAIDADTNMVYLSAGNIYVLDGATDDITGTTIGTSNAWLMAINPVTHRLYAPYNGYGTMAIVDLTSNSVLSTIPVGSGPGQPDVNINTNKIYVGLSNAVAVVNGSTNTVLQTVTVGQAPVGVAVNPNTNRIYTANQASGTVSVIDGSSSSTTNTTPSIPQNLQS
ncbi:MAG: YncE family protein, partial [Nitrosotalea sp.]